MTSYQNPGKIEFDAVLDGTNMIPFPHDVFTLYGVKGRVPVLVHFDAVAYQGSMVKMNTPTHCVFLRNDIRAAVNKPDGASVHVTVELDDVPRTIAVPSDLAAALTAAGLAHAFDQLAFTHRREHVMAIENAKRPETRAKRVLDAVAMIKSKRNPKD